MERTPLLAITQGDPAGIGPEIIAKAFRDAPERMQGCFAVGDVATLRRAAQLLTAPGHCALPVAEIAQPQDAWQVPPMGIYAVFPQRRHLPLRVRLFIELLKATYSRPSYWELR